MVERPKKNRKRNTFLLLLLALLCIGAAELTATYFFDPPLYRQITEPVYRGARAVHAAAQSAARQVGQAAMQCGDWTARRLSRLGDACANMPDSQEAGDPVLLLEGVETDLSVTSLEIRDGLEVLTGGVVPIVYFNQGEEPWASRNYGSDLIRGYGCGPVLMAMAVSSMTEQYVTPVEMCQWAVENGHWAKRGGSYLSLIQGAAAAYGLTAQPVSEYTVDAVEDALLSNRMLVALMGPGHFTKGGHFILLRGITLGGKLLVADPNSEERSLVEWDPQLILDELSSSTSDGAPLWVLSAP